MIAYTRGGEFMPKLDEGALWVRATMPYTISFEESSTIVPQVRADPEELPGGDRRRVGARPRRRRHRSDRILQRRVLRRAQAVSASGTATIHSKDELIDAIDEEAVRVPGHHVQLHAAGGGCGR